MGKVDEVLRIREDFRDLLRNMRSSEDQTLEEEAVSGKIDEEKVIRIAQVLHEMLYWDRSPDETDLVKAIGLMDLLDVLGLQIRWKGYKGSQMGREG